MRDPERMALETSCFLRLPVTFVTLYHHSITVYPPIDFFLNQSQFHKYRFKFYTVLIVYKHQEAITNKATCHLKTLN